MKTLFLNITIIIIICNCSNRRESRVVQTRFCSLVLFFYTSTLIQDLTFLFEILIKKTAIKEGSRKIGIFIFLFNKLDT